MPSALLANASLGLLRHYCSIIFATSFCFTESFSFSVSVKTTGIDPTAVLADSNNVYCNICKSVPFMHLNVMVGCECCEF